MDYTAVLSSGAEADLRALSPELQKAVGEHLRELVAAPTAHSRPSTFPYLPGGLISTFFFTDLTGQRHHFNIRFKYGADEQTLQILTIGHMLLADGP